MSNFFWWVNPWSLGTFSCYKNMLFFDRELCSTVLKEAIFDLSFKNRCPNLMIRIWSWWLMFQFFFRYKYIFFVCFNQRLLQDVRLKALSLVLIKLALYQVLYLYYSMVQCSGALQCRLTKLLFPIRLFLILCSAKSHFEVAIVHKTLDIFWLLLNCFVSSSYRSKLSTELKCIAF